MDADALNRIVEVVVLTVIPTELRATKAALGFAAALREKDPHDGTIYQIGAVHSSLCKRDYGVALACVGGAGNTAAAACAAFAIARFRPKVLLVCGIAGGYRNKIKIGDVAISDRIVAYEPAAEVRASTGSSAQEPRPETSRPPNSLNQDLIHYDPSAERLSKRFVDIKGTFPVAPVGKEEEYAKHVASSINLAPRTIGSGEKLFRNQEKLMALREIHGKIEVVEMEAAGVVDACERAGVGWLIFRGISDFGDDFKDDRFHAFASKTASVVLADFLENALDLGTKPPAIISAIIKSEAAPPANLVKDHKETIERLQSTGGVSIMVGSPATLKDITLLEPVDDTAVSTAPTNAPPPSEGAEKALVRDRTNQLIDALAAPFFAAMAHAILDLVRFGGLATELSEPAEVRSLDPLSSRDTFVRGPAIFSEYCSGVRPLFPRPPNPVHALSRLGSAIDDPGRMNDAFLNGPSTYIPFARMPPVDAQTRVGFLYPRDFRGFFIGMDRPGEGKAHAFNRGIPALIRQEDAIRFAQRPVRYRAIARTIPYNVLNSFLPGFPLEYYDDLLRQGRLTFLDVTRKDCFVEEDGAPLEVLGAFNFEITLTSSQDPIASSKLLASVARPLLNSFDRSKMFAERGSSMAGERWVSFQRLSGQSPQFSVLHVMELPYITFDFPAVLSDPASLIAARRHADKMKGEILRSILKGASESHERLLLTFTYDYSSAEPCPIVSSEYSESRLLAEALRHWLSKK